MREWLRCVVRRAERLLCIQKAIMNLPRRRMSCIVSTIPRYVALTIPTARLWKRLTYTNSSVRGVRRRFLVAWAEGGYKCISKNNDDRGTMCNSGIAGDREYYCSKICVVETLSTICAESLKTNVKCFPGLRAKSQCSPGGLRIWCIYAQPSNKAEWPEKVKI